MAEQPTPASAHDITITADDLFEEVGQSLAQLTLERDQARVLARKRLAKIGELEARVLELAAQVPAPGA